MSDYKIVMITPVITNEVSYCKAVAKYYDPDLLDEDFSYIRPPGNFNLANAIEDYYYEHGNEEIQAVIFSPTPIDSPTMYPKLEPVAFKRYPDIALFMPFVDINYLDPAPLVLVPDKIPPFITAGTNYNGYNDYRTGQGLEFTDDAHYIHYSDSTQQLFGIEDIGGVTQNGIYTRIRCNAALPYIVTAGMKCHVSGVAGFANNPNGRFTITSANTASWPNIWIEFVHDLGAGAWTDPSGQITSNFLSGVVAAVASKINRIRRERQCSVGEAVEIARLTASGGGVRNDTIGYGIIDTEAAINYSGTVPEDSRDAIGEVGELQLTDNEDGTYLYEWEEVENAKGYLIHVNGETVLSEAARFEFNKTLYHLPVGNLTFAYRGYRSSNILTEFSNNLNLSVMLSSKPIKSKYTLGDTVYFLSGSAVSSSTISQVKVRVTNPLNDSNGVQKNLYKLTGHGREFSETELFASKNSLLKNLKGQYLNENGLEVNAIYINSINTGVSSGSIDDYSGMNMYLFNFTDPDPVNNPETPMEIDSACIFDDCNLNGVTLPANVDTKAEFRSVVKSYDEITTIWTDGNPIGRS